MLSQWIEYWINERIATGYTTLKHSECKVCSQQYWFIAKTFIIGVCLNILTDHENINLIYFIIQIIVTQTTLYLTNNLF